MLLKILTGELRVGVSQTLVVRALAQAADLPVTTIAARLMGEWPPTAEWFASLLSHEHDRQRSLAALSVLPGVAARGRPIDAGRSAASGWSSGSGTASARSSCAAPGRSHLWSRGEELITHRFPEIAAAATRLPDGTVLDGEVLAFRDDRPLPFSALQQRIGRQKQVAQMARAVPVVFMTYDVLEMAGRDIRSAAAARRGARCWNRCWARTAGVLRISPIVKAATLGRARDAPRRLARARTSKG